MKLPLLLRFGVLCTLSVSASTLSAGEVFSDNFSDGNRNGWFSSSLTTGGGISASSNALEINSGRSVQTAFTATSLGLGDSISLRFDVSFDTAGDAGSGFRFGLFDSAGSPLPTGDGNSAYRAYNGIIAATNAGATSGSPASFRYRNPNLSETVSGYDTLMTTMTNVYTTIGSNGATAVKFPTDTILNVDLTLLRTETGLDLSFSIKNGVTLLQSYAVSYNSPKTYTFDFLGIGGLTNLGAFTIDNVSVYAVPEPSSYALLAVGAGVAASTMVRRRRRLG